MSRPKRREQEPLFDPELADLPEGAPLARMAGSGGSGDLCFADARATRGAGETGWKKLQSRRSSIRHSRRIAREAL